MPTLKDWIEVTEQNIASRRGSCTEEQLVVWQGWLDTVKEWQANPESVTAYQFLAHLGNHRMKLVWVRDFWRAGDKGESPLSESEKWKALGGRVHAYLDKTRNAKG